MENTGNEKTVKDMSVEYIHKLASILEEIDFLKFKLMSSKKSIMMLHQRIHALYCHIYGKMNKAEIDMQTELRKKISNSGQVFYYKNSKNEYGEVEKILRYHPQKFSELSLLLEDRELHLRQVIERAGLTVSSIEKKKRLF